MEYEIDAWPFLRAPCFVLRLLGVNLRPCGTWMRVVQGVVQGVVLVAGGAVVVASTVHALTNRESLADKMLQMVVVVVVLTSAIKIVVVSANVDNINTVVEQIFSGVAHPEAVVPQVEEFRKSCRRPPRLMLAVMLVTFALMLVGGIASRLLTPAHNVLRSEFLVQVLLPETNGLAVAANVGLTATLATFAVGHLGFLQLFVALLVVAVNSLQHLNRTLHMLQQPQIGPGENERVREILDYAIQQHQRCIRFVDGINKIFSTVMLMETWRIMFIILSVIYYSIQSGYSWKTTILMFATAVTCFHYGTICYLASEISNESEKVNSNCNSVSWWNWMPGFELDISIMSTRARDPLHLKAGPFYKLNLKTFLTILKLSVTYLLILLQFNK